MHCAVTSTTNVSTRDVLVVRDKDCGEILNTGKNHSRLIGVAMVHLGAIARLGYLPPYGSLTPAIVAIDPFCALIQQWKPP